MSPAFQPIPDGHAGIDQILATLAALKAHYGRVYAIRAAAIAIAGGRVNNDQGAHVARLAAFVRDAMIYVADPVNAEVITTPDVLLLEINRTGRARGDCDDFVLLFASLSESIGVPCDIAGVSMAGDRIDHVIGVAHPHGQPVDFDLCAPANEQPMYARKVFAP